MFMLIHAIFPVWLVLVLYLIGQEDSTNFLSQSCTTVTQRPLTLNTLKVIMWWLSILVSWETAVDAYPGDKKFEPKLNTFSNNPCQRMIEIFVYVSISACVNTTRFTWGQESLTIRAAHFKGRFSYERVLCIFIQRGLVEERNFPITSRSPSRSLHPCAC